MAASTTPQHHHVAEDENENEEELTNGDAGGDVSRDLDTDEHIKDPIEDRRTLAERNERLHDQLKVRANIGDRGNMLRTPIEITSLDSFLKICR